MNDFSIWNAHFPNQAYMNFCHLSNPRTFDSNRMLFLNKPCKKYFERDHRPAVEVALCHKPSVIDFSGQYVLQLTNYLIFQVNHDHLVVKKCVRPHFASNWLENLHLFFLGDSFTMLFSKVLSKSCIFWPYNNLMFYP